MNKIAIENGRLIDPANNIDTQATLFIADGKVVGNSSNFSENFAADLSIDAKGSIVSPGFVDLNASLNICRPRAEFSNELKNACSVGITSVCTKTFFQNQFLDLPDIESISKPSSMQAHVYFIASLTVELQGKQLNNLSLLNEIGCLGFSNDKQSIVNSLIKYRCYDYAAMLGVKIFITPNDSYLSGSGCAHEGDMNLRLGLPGIPTLAESSAVAQELLMIEETGVNAHFNSLTSDKALQILEVNKKKLPITLDVTISHLHLTEIDLTNYNTNCYVLPPFRSEKDRISLIQSLGSGLIDAISSDQIRISMDRKKVSF